MINKLTPLCAKRGNALIIQKSFKLGAKDELIHNKSGQLKVEESLFKRQSKTKLLSETFKQTCGITNRKGFKFDPYKTLYRRGYKKDSNNSSVLRSVTGTLEIPSSFNKLKEKMIRSAKSLKLMKREKNKGSFRLSRLKRVIEKTVMKRIRTSKMSDVLSRNIGNQLKHGIKRERIFTMQRKTSGEEVLILSQFAEDQLPEKVNATLPIFNKKKINPKLAIKPIQMDYDNLDIHRQSSASPKHEVRKRVEKETTMSKFNFVIQPAQVGVSPTIQIKNSEFSAQAPKKEINFLDKLRNISRSAYSIGSLYNLSSNISIK